MIVLPFRPVQLVTKESWWLLPGRWSVLLPSLGLWLPGVIILQLNICEVSWKTQRNIKWCDPHDTMLLCLFKWIFSFETKDFSWFFLCERALYVQWHCLVETETLLCFPNCKPWKKQRWSSNLSWYWNFPREPTLPFSLCEIWRCVVLLWSETRLHSAVFCLFCVSDYKEKMSCDTSKF